MRRVRTSSPRERGVALIIVIIILFFMVAVGFALFGVTRTNPDMAGNIRWHQQVFDTAEAGMDASLKLIGETVDDFTTKYRTTFSGQPGLDDPTSTNYFRGLTDKQLVDDVASGTDNFLFSTQTLPDSSQLCYTAFLIDNNAASPSDGHDQALLVCIGRGPENTYVRLEVLLELE